MGVGPDVPARLGRWCAERVPERARDELRVGYSIRGDVVTIVERHRPAYPELGAAWSSTPVARLRRHDPGPGLWRIYAPTGDGRWAPYDHPPCEGLDSVLDEIDRDPRSVFWG